MLTIRDLDPAVKARIQRRAREHGRSMEAEVREILRRAVERDEEPEGLGQVLVRAFADLDPAEIPDFTADRQPPRGMRL